MILHRILHSRFGCLPRMDLLTHTSVRAPAPLQYDSSKKWAVARLVLDFIQCFVLIVRPSYGWQIDQESM